MEAGMANIKIVVTAISKVDIFIHGKHFWPLLNFTLSKIAPNRASFTASHTFTTSITAAVFERSIPWNIRNVTR